MVTTVDATAKALNIIVMNKSFRNSATDFGTWHKRRAGAVIQIKVAVLLCGT